MNQMSYCGPPGGGLGGLQQCWNDVQAVEALLTKIMTDILQNNPSIIGTPGALKGVTDGSAAAPGIVGEIISFGQTITFPASNPEYITLTNMGTLPAGDWALWAWLGTNVPINSFVLDNVPTTDTNLDQNGQNALIPAGMGWFGVALATPGVSEQLSIGTIVSSYRGAGPVNIILRTIISTIGAGELSLGFEARRMR